MTGRHRSPQQKTPWRDNIANFLDVRQRRAAKRYWAATKPPPVVITAELADDEAKDEWPSPLRIVGMMVVYAAVTLVALILAFWTIFFIWWVMWP